MQADQFSAQLKLFELLVIIDAGEFEAVDLFVLPQHGIMRAAQHRVPMRNADMSMAQRTAGGAVGRTNAGAGGKGDGQRKNEDESS